MLNTLPDTSEQFAYAVKEIKVVGDTAEAKIYMNWSHVEENVSTMKFVKKGNFWKIDYFDK